MQGVCERFLRFLVGEDPDLVVCDCSRGGTGVADEVGGADAAIAVAEQVQARGLVNQAVEFGDAFEVADLVLRQAARPAADGLERGLGNWTEDVTKLRERYLRDFLIGARSEGGGSLAAEEGPQDASASWSTVWELLIDEGAGEQLLCVCGALRNEKAEAGWDVEGVGGFGRPGEADENGGAGASRKKGKGRTTARQESGGNWLKGLEKLVSRVERRG